VSEAEPPEGIAERVVRRDRGGEAQRTIKPPTIGGAGDFDPPTSALREVVARSLAEDLGVLGDITSLAVIPGEAAATGRFVTRVPGVLAGTAGVTEVFRQLDPSVVVQWQSGDGDDIEPGKALGVVSGSLRSILAGERTALNLLRHCSAIATLTRRFVRSAHGRTRILDTRKTTPGLRALEKAAVRAGGGFNHRDSLSDAVLIKDNHLVGHDLRTAISRARARWPGRMVECECDTLAQVSLAAAAGADRILLDNMSPDEVKEAIVHLGGSVPVEVSGGVTLETIAAYASVEPDFVSVGAITHSAGQLDLALDLD
jgi:nicotinate-nucleotide pyrophosphorylase (carboxylating)